MAHPPAPQTAGRPATDSTPTTGSTRQRLLSAAYEVLLDEGYHAATVQNVARRAHLTTGAIYANFTSKHELLVQAVLERWAQSPELNPLQLLPSPAAEAPGVPARSGVAGREGPGAVGGDPLADPPVDAGDIDTVETVDTGDISEFVRFLADQLTAAPSPEHRLLTEVAGAAIRHDTAMSRLRGGIEVVEAFAREAIVRAQAEGRLDERFPTDVLVTLAVNLYLGSITAKSFNLPQPDPDAVQQVLALLALSPGSAGQPGELGQPARRPTVEPDR